jgi:hypothetical protein
VRGAAGRESRSPPPKTAIVAEPFDGPPAPAVLRRLVGELADQRRRLIHLWEECVRLHAEWQQERATLLADLEVNARRLDDRAQEQESQRRDLEVAYHGLCRRREAVVQHEQRLEAWHARLTLEESELRSERERVLSEAAQREERTESVRQQLEELRAEWTERRRQELEPLHESRRQYVALRQRYARLWRHVQRQRAILARDQRALTTKMLALEQWQLEFLPQTDDPPAAERRLERLERKERAQRQEAEEELARQEKALRRECARLEERAQRLDAEEAALTERDDEMCRRLEDFESCQAAWAAGDAQRQDEMQQLRQWQEQDQRQIAALRDEVERLARLLLGEETSEQGPALAA